MADKIKYDDARNAPKSRILEQPKTPSVPSRTDNVPFSAFAKLDLRVGEILEVNDHPNASKLLVLKVNLGEEEPRTIVAGLRGYYSKEDLEGKKAIFVANLEPVVLRGVESNGMILAAVSGDRKKVFFLSPEKDIEAGTKVS
jgi:methionyl-tRNA synthetase